MAYLIGISLAIAISTFATFVGFDRNRAFYPTVAMVVASYYALFAVLGGSPRALAAESVVIGGFILLAVLGFKLTLWFAVVALAAHGLFDFAHAHLIANPGVPPWWPAFCASYDVVAAAYLAWLLRHRKADERPT